VSRFQELVQQFSSYFEKKHFPDHPQTLYGAASYMLEEGGKRIRPVLCLLGNELFGEIHPDTWKIASAIELFHNFTLIHDDIMDKASLRRNRATVHTKYNEPTALLAGDVMLLQAYEYLNDTSAVHVQDLIRQLNKAGREVCEGQQMDMDFENTDRVSLADYIKMIELKTAVLLAASLRMGATVAGADNSDLENIYAFGVNMGLAFQIQDDYLDSFGNPEKFGKTRGGDILANKKTFLLVESLEKASVHEKSAIDDLLVSTKPGKVDSMIEIYQTLKIDRAAENAKQHYMQMAFDKLGLIKVPEANKRHLQELANYILEREN
jgi:geranylgeranyl diphosphate synthase, type II